MAEKAIPSTSILANLGALLPKLEAIYKDIHSHPELSMPEDRTAGIAADRLRSAGYEVTTGVDVAAPNGLAGRGAQQYNNASKEGPIWRIYERRRKSQVNEKPRRFLELTGPYSIPEASREGLHNTMAKPASNSRH